MSFAKVGARSDSAPTAQEVALYEDLADRAQGHITELRHVIETEVLTFNSAMHDAGVPAILVPFPSARPRT